MSTLSEGKSGSESRKRAFSDSGANRSSVSLSLREEGFIARSGIVCAIVIVSATTVHTAKRSTNNMANDVQIWNDPERFSQWMRLMDYSLYMRFDREAFSTANSSPTLFLFWPDFEQGQIDKT